jgi:RNA polymerase sigma factor (sigma-70 family)
MTGMSWDALRNLLTDRYGELRSQLARRLGSADLASESLHETWLKLGRAGDVGYLDSPEAYLLRVALNVAAYQRKVEQRRLAYSEVELMLRFDEDELDPERILVSRSDTVALAHALNELSPRRRAIFILARLEKMPHQEIAARFGISVRTVNLEWSHALKHCSDRLEKKS